MTFDDFKTTLSSKIVTFKEEECFELISDGNTNCYVTTANFETLFGAIITDDITYPDKYVSMKQESTDNDLGYGDIFDQWHDEGLI